MSNTSLKPFEDLTLQKNQLLCIAMRQQNSFSWEVYLDALHNVYCFADINYNDFKLLWIFYHQAWFQIKF